MKILKDNAVNQELWKSLLLQSAFSSPFQTPEFFEFYNSINGCAANVFALKEKDELIALCIVTLQNENGIKKYFSRRAVIYGGPVLHEDTPVQSIRFFMEEVERHYRKKAIYLEIRNYFDYSDFKVDFKANGFQYVPWLNFQVKTDDLSSVKRAMSNSRLRQVKKAIKNGAEWKVAKNEFEVREFYKILQRLYIHKIKKPLFPQEFFTGFFNSNAGKILIVNYNGKVIGGIVCPVLENRGIYEFYVCGLDSEYKDQYPSVMATWAAIEYASQNNIPLFDFMGAGSPDEAYGVREFKSRFGGEEVEYGRFLKVLNPVLFRIGKIGLAVLSKN